MCTAMSDGPKAVSKKEYSGGILLKSSCTCHSKLIHKHAGIMCRHVSRSVSIFGVKDPFEGGLLRRLEWILCREEVLSSLDARKSVEQDYGPT